MPGSTGRTYVQRPKNSSEDERAALARRISDLRRGKVGRLVDLRHAGKLPESLDLSLKYLVVYHAHIIPPPNASLDQGDRYVRATMRRWAAKRGLHLSPEDLDHIEDAAGSAWMYAGQVGRVLELTDVERQELQFWQARPVDVSWEDLLARRRAKARHRHERYRRRKGALPRHEYLAKAQSKPWIDLGISRATFYRRWGVRQLRDAIYQVYITALRTCLTEHARRRSASEADPDAKAAPFSVAMPSAASSVLGRPRPSILTRQLPIEGGAIAAGFRWRAALIIAKREPVRAAAMVAAEIDLIHNGGRAQNEPDRKI